MMAKQKGAHNWLFCCPYCGRAYTPSILDLILRSRLKGVLAMGCPRRGNGTFGSADIGITAADKLDENLGEGLFERVSKRFWGVLDNWLGHGWIDAFDLYRHLRSRISIFGGYPVGNFGPGYKTGFSGGDKLMGVWAGGREIKSDELRPIWG